MYNTLQWYTKINKYLTPDIVKKIFPPNDITGDYIVLLRLLPKISNGLPGQIIKLSAKLSINTASEDGVYNVVSCCAYLNTVDKMARDAGWTEINNKLKEDSEITDDLLLIKKNDWFNHHSKRLYIEKSFDFILQTLF